MPRMNASFIDPTASWVIQVPLCNAKHCMRSHTTLLNFPNTPIWNGKEKGKREKESADQRMPQPSLSAFYFTSNLGLFHFNYLFLKQELV